MDWRVEVILSYDGFRMRLHRPDNSTNPYSEIELEGFWLWLISGFAPLEHRVRYAAKVLAMEALDIEKRHDDTRAKAEIAAKLTTAAQSAFEQAYQQLKARQSGSKTSG